MIISTFVFDSITYAMENGALSIEQKRGILNSNAKETKKQTSSQKLETHFTAQYRLQNYFQIIIKKTTKSATIYN